MDFDATLALTALALGLTALFAWLGARAPNPLKGPRLLPYRMLMALCAAAALVLATHLAGLAGLVKKQG